MKKKNFLTGNEIFLMMRKRADRDRKRRELITGKPKHITHIRSIRSWLNETRQ